VYLIQMICISTEIELLFCFQLNKLRFFQATSHITFLLYINSHLFWHFISETQHHLFLQCFKIKPIIEELSTMIIGLCLK
jgi:hypothetical protein